jgi:hypothetical protein
MGLLSRLLRLRSPGFARACAAPAAASGVSIPRARRAPRIGERVEVELGRRQGFQLSGRALIEPCVCGEGERSGRPVVIHLQTGAGVCASCERSVVQIEPGLLAAAGI